MPEETSNWNFHHLGVIVNDIAKAVEYYQSLGFVKFPPQTAGSGSQPVWKEITIYGKTVIKDGQPLVPIKPGSKLAGLKFCRVGSVILELIQPGEGFGDVNADFLKSVGEGINHIGYTVDAEHFDQEVEKMKAKGLPIVFSGKEANGAEFVYFDTRKVGGIIIELMRVAS